MFDGKEYVYAVYEEKSFSKAAQKLYITQPALSTAIKKNLPHFHLSPKYI